MPPPVRRFVRVLTCLTVLALAAVATAAAGNGGLAPVVAGLAEREEHPRHLLADPRDHRRDLRARDRHAARSSSSATAARAVRASSRARRSAATRSSSWPGPRGRSCCSRSSPASSSGRSRTSAPTSSVRRGQPGDHGRGTPVLLGLHLPERRDLGRHPAPPRRPHGPADGPLCGRQPQLVDPRARRKARRDPGPDQPPDLPRDQARHLRRAVRRVLRPAARGDAGPRPGAAGRPVRLLGERPRERPARARQGDLRRRLRQVPRSRRRRAAIGPNIAQNPLLGDKNGLTKLFRHGTGKMPAVGNDWSQAQLDATIAYLHQRFVKGASSGSQG